ERASDTRRPVARRGAGRDARWLVQEQPAGFGQYDINSSGLDLGYGHRSRFMADGRADYCRFVGDYHAPFLSCTTATASGTVGQYNVNSAGLDLGYANMPIFMADVDDSGKASYCRFVGDPSFMAFSCAAPIISP
ncbi:MAG: hypothetical protein AAF657_33355, partial [Acidobacteriota bacterium]